MGLSCSGAISGLGWVGIGMVGWDLCAGLLYEHRFAMLIIQRKYFLSKKVCSFVRNNPGLRACGSLPPLALVDNVVRD